MFCEDNNFPLSSEEERAKSFGKLSDAYDKGRKAPDAAIYDLLASHIPHETTVLDIGCGTGISTWALMERFSEVYGCDLDPKMLAFAKKKAKDPSHFIEASAYELPFSSEKFDLVTHFASFHWFCNKKALTEISRVIKKGGFIYIVDTFHLLKEESQAIIKSVLGYQTAQGVLGYEPDKILLDSGFSLLFIKEVEVKHNFTIDEAMHLFQSYSNWIDVQKSGKEKEVLAGLLELCQKSAGNNGIILHIGLVRALLAKKPFEMVSCHC